MGDRKRKYTCSLTYIPGRMLAYKLSKDQDRDLSALSRIESAIPPDEAEAHFCTDRIYTKPERWAVNQGARVAASLLVMFARAVTIVDTVATIALLIANERVLTARGFVHGRALPEQMPMYINEVALLHAPRAPKEWMGTVD